MTRVDRKMDEIELRFGDEVITDCSCVILVPERAREEPGYIKAITRSSGAGAKHEFHALAQMAYYQYEDEELEVLVRPGTWQVRYRDEQEELADGLLVYRTVEGAIRVFTHEEANRRKLLETANRFCTRWVRLDI